MILIVVKWQLRPDKVDSWLDQVSAFTDATRAEPGNLFFEWSRSVDDPDTFLLVEGFADDDAGAAHVGSEHFRTAIGWMPDWVASTPKIINIQGPGDGWGEMGEVIPR
ncbi:Quinol monooxygenase YgiN [Jatrophihabitans endophyticus]|uniref:Quinol monooxygenase YgiN n=1 Tax=Jatrophihabitans endophyticus TaxID=1206085 RepID=A0A1M5BWK6_9ACTN|nr:putative quinol monooxygenase [Jatrophihabitans endophyticus]SHF46938.1 Quinol monooxygenase YgiN [Jatrophihabitans endophyticus]